MTADDHLARMPLDPEPPEKQARLGHTYEDAHVIGLNLAGKQEAYDEIVAMLEADPLSDEPTFAGLALRNVIRRIAEARP